MACIAEGIGWRKVARARSVVRSGTSSHPDAHISGLFCEDSLPKSGTYSMLSVGDQSPKRLLQNHSWLASLSLRHHYPKCTQANKVKSKTHCDIAGAVIIAVAELPCRDVVAVKVVVVEIGAWMGTIPRDDEE